MKDMEKNGGPAFPVEAGDVTYFGMSLRDYFAAKALPKAIEQEMGAHGKYRHFCKASGEIIAKASYMVADAMLEARK